MRVLIVKLSSLGDVVHAMPVVHDIQAAHPDAVIDWIVEPGFAPLLRRVYGMHDVIECALRRWTKAWWTKAVRLEWRAFRARLTRDHYDAVIDLQGLTKSALIARLADGVRYGLANRTEGASHEPPARWLVDHAIHIEPHIHALDRSRELAARALGYTPQGSPQFGLRVEPRARPAGWRPTLVFVHGSSRADKLWPEASWIALGQRAIAAGWRIAIPHVGQAERLRAERLQAALLVEANAETEAHASANAEVWPEMALDALVDRLGASDGVIGVDSGLSHIATALYLPHVQIYNFPTAWRTGPQPAHGHRHQVSVSVSAQGEPTPSVDAVWRAWCGVLDSAPA